MWPNFFISVIIKHGQKIFDVAEFVVGLVEASSNSDSVSVGTDAWNSSNDSIDLLVNETLVLVNVPST